MYCIVKIKLYIIHATFVWMSLCKNQVQCEFRAGESELCENDECNFFTISFNIPYNQTIDSILLKIKHLVANISLA